MANDLPQFEAIALRRDGRVLHATFNRPETLNAIDIAMQDELLALMELAATDDETLVLVLTGAGKAFCAGGNAAAVQETIESPKLFLEGAEKGKKLLHAILDCPKPIIAKVNGAAMGLGATIALFCDVTVAAEHAKIADPHVRFGLPAGDGGAVIWPALIGFNKAKRYLLTGDAVTGSEAAAIGLVDSAVPADELDAAVDALAQRIAAGAPQAVQFTKAAVNIELKAIVQRVLHASFALEALAARSKDHQEAIDAFLEKRPPVFTGE
jgi:enoyl-CoA hydratase